MFPIVPIAAGLLASATGSADVGTAVLCLALIGASGLALGSLRMRGIGLGSAGVLFSGILFGHFGAKIDPAILDFVREFGLILFVFCIGLQLGPGFFASLRKEGVRLNMLATVIVGGGALLAVATGLLLRLDPAASLGLFSGATTNTPSLGAIQQTLTSLTPLDGGDEARKALPALAYAVAYPVGIAGIIGSLLILRWFLKVDPSKESEQIKLQQRSAHPALERMNIIVENRNLEGVRLDQVPGRAESQVVVSRIRFRDESTVHAATPDMVLHVGDSLLAVGTPAGLESFRCIVGSTGHEDLMEAPGNATFDRVRVTNASALGKTLAELNLEETYGVSITRVTRGDLQLPATRELELNFGDTLRVVGTREHIALAAKALGNSMRAINETHFIAIFIGIALGVLAGSKPVDLPGLPVPLRLGLAGGPLVLAILLGRLGHFRGLVWHMPLNVNMALRELGMTLFLACVGLKAGTHFFSTVFTLTGLLWIASAVVITMIPLLGIGYFASRVLKLNFPTLSGLLAGSMTDPPALAFANSVCNSDTPAISYATVYPLTMLLRIVLGQLLTLWLWK